VLGALTNICRETQSSLKSDKNIGHFAWVPHCVYFVLSDMCSVTIPRTHGCASMTTLSVSYYTVDDICTERVQRERIVAFSWQQGLRERATVLRCAYIAFLVRFDLQKLHGSLPCSEQTWFHMCLLRSAIERNPESHIETAKEVFLPHFIPFRWDAVFRRGTHARAHTHTHTHIWWLILTAPDRRQLFR